MPEIGRGAQVTLTGASQGAARGAISPTLTGNTDARNAATPLVNQGTPAPAEEGLGEALPANIVLEMLPYAPNDAVAAEAGVPMGGFYRNTAGLQQRQA